MSHLRQIMLEELERRNYVAGDDSLLHSRG